MLKKIVLAVVAILLVSIVVFGVAVAMQPDEFRVSRSAHIAAAPDVVFAQVNNFHNWEAWSPWAELDPNATETFSGPDEGEGASFAWAGNDEVGVGHMKITESRPHELILIRLEFIKPFPGVSTTEFRFEPKDNGTEVVWTMSGENDFMGKAFCLLMDMDAMIGADFERGLASMKAVAEAKAAEPATSSHTGGTETADDAAPDPATGEIAAPPTEE